MGGNRGYWTVVRSRKRKATEPKIRGQATIKGSDGQGDTAKGGGQVRQSVFTRLAVDSNHDQLGGDRNSV